MPLLLWTLLVGAMPSAESSRDVAVVCPEVFRAPLAPWVAHRTRQGYRVRWISSQQSPDKIRGAIRQVGESGRLQAILLVGDAPSLGQSTTAAQISPHYAPAQVNVHWGSEPTIASDNWYADLDDDRVPDVAIGRLTPDSPSELQAIVAKILAYENPQNIGLWRRRVSLVAGTGGFGPLTDMLLENVTKTLIASRLPAGYGSHITYASWTSPYCPDPRRLVDANLEQLNAGSLFWVYIGHSHYHALAGMQAGQQDYRLLDLRDMPRLQCRQGRPIALFMACYAGAFDARRDCLAEAMLRAPGGPVAVIAGSRVTMPYAMALLATGLWDECVTQRRATLGEALLAAKRRLADRQADGPTRAALHLLARTISPAPNQLDAERLEHVELFNLLGDPLLVLRHPQSVTFDKLPAAQAGQPVVVRGHTAVAGQATLELVVRRDRLTFTPQARVRFAEEEALLQQMDQDYRRANQPVLAVMRMPVAAGNFQATLDIPEQATGACDVRMFVAGKTEFALGAVALEIKPGERKTKRPAPVP